MMSQKTKTWISHNAEWNGAEHLTIFTKNFYYFIVHYFVFCSKVFYIDTKIIATVIAKLIYMTILS